MDVFSIIFTLLINILLTARNGHCKTLPAKLNDSIPIAETATKSDTNDLIPMTVDPLVLQYLADHMSSQECFQFYNYLVSSQHQNKMTLNRTWSYQDYIHDPMKKGRGEFPCYSSLKQWSFRVQSLARSELDKRKYAETFLLVALHKINRRDLHSWMDKVIRSVQVDEIQHVEKELHHVTKSKRKSKREHNFEEEEARSLMILGFICFVFFAGVTVLIAAFIWISVKLKTRDYIPLNSTDGSTNQRQKWGNETSRGYYSFVPGYEDV